MSEYLSKNFKLFGIVHINVHGKYEYVSLIAEIRSKNHLLEKILLPNSENFNCQLSV